MKAYLFTGIILLSIFLSGCMPIESPQPLEEIESYEEVPTEEVMKAEKKVEKIDITKPEEIEKEVFESKVYYLEQPMPLGDLKFTVHDYKTMTRTSGDYYYTRAKGIFLVFDVSIENTGSQRQFTTGDYFIVKDKQGRSYLPERTLGLFDIYPSWYDDLNPGLAIRERIYFDVPKDFSGFLEINNNDNKAIVSYILEAKEKPPVLEEKTPELSMDVNITVLNQSAYHRSMTTLDEIKIDLKNTGDVDIDEKLLLIIEIEQANKEFKIEEKELPSLIVDDTVKRTFNEDINFEEDFKVKVGIYDSWEKETIYSYYEEEFYV
ncbi:MAG: DUF4352 domain-containing protein [Nanoarchaeota archaeon]|nr:DUF4352 domain-containing protein [Nanoarchaeota archaeon]